MAKETVLVDDIDGSPAAETVQFSFRGAQYEIDLTDKHIEQMKKALQPWLDVSRKAGNRATARRRTNTRTNSKSKPKPKKPEPERLATADDIRSWARANGLKVAERGRIPNSVIEQYQSA